MKKNVGCKLKALAVIMFVLCLLIGGLWLYKSQEDYNEYKALIGTDYSDYEYDAMVAERDTTYSIIILIGGTFSSVVLYGFGELVDCVKKISDKVDKM